MKLELYYKNLLLGEFSQKGGKMFYNSNLVGEKIFFDKFSNSTFYNLKGSKNVLIEKLPSFLKNYEHAICNKKFVKLTNIKAKDCFFKKLCKLSKLKFDNDSYYLSLKKHFVLSKKNSLKVKTAVVLLAGYGTRCLPFTKTLPKCMIPVLNKPVIEYIIEEIYASSIEQVILVLPKYCKSSVVKRQFKDNKTLSKFFLKHNLFELEEKTNFVNKLVKIKTIYTSKANGTGGAVLSAKKFIKNQPFAVLNGDDLFFSQKPVLKSLIDKYEQTGNDVLAVVEVPRQSIVNYGICECGNNYEVKKIIEKPTLEQTQSNLALVGRYVLNSNFLKYLKKTKAEPSGEIFITKTMHEKAVSEHDVCCCKVDCKRMDCGNKLGIIKANIILGLEDEQICDELKDFLHQVVKQ